MSLDEALDAWLERHEQNGSTVADQLNPPASAAALDAAEARIGFILPDDLRRLWQRANGQRDFYHLPDPAPGRTHFPLFGQYLFLPLEGALDAYQVWLDIWDGGGSEFDEDFNGEGNVQRRGDDPVYREYWRPGWLPFSDDNGNAYAVDLSPAPGGTVGQVIVIGSDEDERRVLAPSIADFLAVAVHRIQEFALLGGDERGAWFDMEAASPEP